MSAKRATLRGGTAARGGVPEQPEEAEASEQEGYDSIIKQLPVEAQPPPSGMRGKHNYTLARSTSTSRIQVQCGAWCLCACCAVHVCALMRQITLRGGTFADGVLRRPTRARLRATGTCRWGSRWELTAR